MQHDENFIILGISWYIIFVISTTLHEAAHAYIAMKLGDFTAYQGGQVSLNPMPHIEREPMGMILVPLMSYMFMGWVMGFAHIPVNAAWSHRYPKKSALISLAGPIANLLLAFIAALCIWLGIYLGWFTYPKKLIDFMHFTVANGDSPVMFALARTLSMVFFLNALLFVFNLLPFPPLDGSSAVQLFMSGETLHNYRQFLYNPTYTIVAPILAIFFFHSVSQKFILLLLKILYPSITYS